MEALEEVQTPAKSNLELVELEGELAFVHVTLTSPSKGRLLADLSTSVPTDIRVLVVGDDETAGIELFRATAGISISGSGRITRPRLDQIRFIPQRPYLIPGTLRQALEPADRPDNVSEEQILGLLNELELGHLINVGDLAGNRTGVLFCSRASSSSWRLPQCLSQPRSTSSWRRATRFLATNG